MVRGDLAVFPFLSVMQMLLTSGRDGLLSVDHVRGGQLWLTGGEIVHARCGLRTGDAALQILASLSGGIFAFEAGISAPERTLHLHRDSALRRLFEESNAWEPLLRTFPDWQRRLHFTARWSEAQPVSHPQFCALNLVSQQLSIRNLLERGEEAPRTVLDTLRPFVIAGLIESL
ncbi:DUF4388 domain-containing protein [Deinococcus arenicola]|uniref:DUF4388 domain-containing protein n=1 Tax=Deinococcus arenicola TaxID=2994950 RepID=A0ABU4DR39_9DEIO|nr:DUF4388 domain-containing protein [Deinococcus sp. ZS9-10]MDV6374911.1 DUF4388 domain-containing protein [Deinococcus sp. ZS9-10]